MPEEAIAKRILLIRTSYKTELDCWYQPSGESLHLHLRNAIAEEFNTHATLTVTISLAPVWQSADAS